MKRLPLLLAFLSALSLVWTNPQLAHATEPQGLHAYVAYGNNYTFPGSVRLGYKAWEGGLLSSGIYGVVKRHYFSPSLYTEFGPAAIGLVDATGFGVVAGIGFDFDLIFGIGLRGEIMGTAEHNGHLDSRGNIGLSLAF